MHLHVIWCKHEHKWVVGLCRKIEQLTNFYANLTTILIPQLSHPYSTTYTSESLTQHMNL